MTKLVRGIGFNDNTYPVNVSGEWSKEYVLWNSMLSRCTEGVWLRNPTYVGTTCSENFKSYTFFYEWCNKQIGFNAKDDKGWCWCLDKDLLFKGNKVYSEDACLFIPSRINLLLVRRQMKRGEYPIGVYLDNHCGKYKSRCHNGSGKMKHLGYFSSISEAFKAYKSFKEALIKDVANEYKEQLDIRAYQALMQYEVNIDD